MNIPSIKTIMVQLGFSKEKATELRNAMERNKGLSVGNRLLEGFGVEEFCIPENFLSPDMVVRYVNMGDTYDTTLLKVNGRYRIGCWGDIAERYC